MPTQRQKLVAHHVIGLEKSISATAKQIGASPTSVRGSLISYCIKMMPSLEPELTAWVEHKDRGRHRLAVIRAHKDQLMPSVDQPTRRKPMSEEQQAVETAAENCEVLRVRLARYEDADGKPITTIAEQVWEIERLSKYKRFESQYHEAERELAALKAQPSGVVPELPGEYSAACAAARLNSSPVSAGDDRETIRAVFLRNGFTIKEGQVDLKPYVYAAADELMSIARAALSAPSHGEQVRDGWQLVPVEPTDAMLEAGDKYIGTPATYKAMLSACPSPAITKDFSQFLSAVMDAAGLIRHGRQSKELSEYLGMKCMEYRGVAPSAGSQEQGE